MIRQGDAADQFHVIGSGRFNVSQRSVDTARHIRELETGDGFGEIGRLTGVPRTATVTALTDGELLVLDRRVISRSRC